MTKTVSRRRTHRHIADGGMPKGTRSRCLTVKKSVRVTKTSKLFDWPGRVPLSASRDLLPNHKIECAFLLLIIFLSSSSLFICHTGLSSCYADVHVCVACLIVLVLAPTDVAEGRYIKGDPLNGYYDFIITGKSLCVFLVLADKCVSILFRKNKNEEKIV